MWSRLSSVLKPREGIDGDSDAQSIADLAPDPFGANSSTTYYQTPPTPPSNTHSRTASREEDIIWSLRTQLALRQELCSQFEIDLGARDELVQALAIRLDASEKENEKRKSVVRSWRKKAADLERLCRNLEEQVDSGHRESLERSIMDEASGEALRQLHRQISQLEREKRDVEADRDLFAQRVQNAQTEITGLKGQLNTREQADEDVVCQLRHQVSLVEREKHDLEAERDLFAHTLQNAQTDIIELREQLQARDRADEAERQLRRQISQLEQEKSDVEAQCDANEDVVRQLRRHISQLEREKSDVQAQHDALERADGEVVRQLRHQISSLEREKSDVRAQRDAMEQADEEVVRQLRHRITQLEQEKSDVGAQRDDLARVQELQETRLREELEAETARLRTHVQQLQKDNASKEVTIVQLNKQRDQDKQDIDGLNIALESKQQELELVKRTHGTRGTVGLASGRVNTRTSSSPAPARVPSALGKVTNTRPPGPVSSVSRRASSSSVEIGKTKPSGRRPTMTSRPSGADEKENHSTPIASRPQRRTMVLA